ncbi:putative ribosome quality control (RQC) complex YloA/Tae2 family protein [Clostridium tetanomorphum]|uniref:Rqc2 homolog RqcH n=1 Tax=Clostridium tetanomorphum TaxID=1553 RepID=A0A923IYP4_CLOTT|nr:NFACT RNA binding domain-containing protein [Clostridium tetanomorphum]KAJ53418.1 fibronectin-binding protein [Clostridium tetanomorphum DSM 665]MBC2396596.1 fibronectin/fibrinogen-binding protein [Clostridium tetanomorphum]MBP1863924.1 putative ribosome quality control (RQC) complex YloA/Tae2 family protein [Clostridium tetanomorphum]NRS85002.1 putative ribosome quality control (RQC) complex YloA/Tae2 family protein [Clostridium tetanomorphum]NRZ98218.1 putative ribosome quality control (R
MALDGIFLYSITEELKNLILNGKVEKINQPEKDELIISIKKDRNSYKLLLSASAVYPRIHIIKTSKLNPISPPMFCMLLRKHLNNSKIVNVRQLDTDRILFLDFQTKDELGFNSIYSLVIEIMGRHSNITLVRERDNIIMDSIKHVTSDMNSFRCLYPGIPYVFPPASQKLNPLNYTYEDLASFVSNKNIKFDKNFSSKVFTGISTQFSREIFYRISILNIDINDLKLIHKELENIFSNIKNKNFFFASYLQDNIYKDFYCLKLTNLENCSFQKYLSPSELLDKYYYDKDKEDRLTSKSANLLKLINNNLDRCYKKIEILEDTLKKCDKKEKYKTYGELLTANIYSIKQGQEKAKVLNYYSGVEEYIEIPLDPNKTPAQNIQIYFKKYTKLKKSEEASTYQIEATKDEINYLQSVFTSIKNVEDYKGIEDIKNELMETGYIKFKKILKKKQKESKPMHFISSEGVDIYVGKNNIQNDYLTLKFSNNHDIWMHTKDIPGSHVIIKTTKNFSDKTLEEGANLAAYYSKGKDSSKVAVDYTEIKNVHKPNGAKPGMVIYYTNKTIYITPEKPNLKRLT